MGKACHHEMECSQNYEPSYTSFTLGYEAVPYVELHR